MDLDSRIADILIPNFTSDIYSGSLNTPPPPVIDQNRGESISSDDLTEFIKDLPLPSNADLLQTMETIVSDVQVLKTSTVENEKIHRRQNKSIKKLEANVRKNTESIATIHKQNQYIIFLLEKLTQTNNTQRFTQSNNSEFPLIVPERPTNREQIPIDEPVNISIENTQPHHVSSLPSESNVRTDDQNLNRLTTTNELKSNGQLLYPTDDIDKIRLEKNRGKIQISQWCHEINVATTNDAPSSTEPKNQTQSKENPINYQTTILTDNLLSSSNDGSTKISLLHPVKEIISEKNERDTIVKDCLGNNLVLLVYGNGLPNDVYIDMVAVFKSSGIPYHSIHRFSDREGGYKDMDSRLIKTSNNSPQRIELNDVRLHRGCNNDMKREIDVSCKNYIKKESTFTLVRYPSGVIEPTKITSAKELNKEYNYKQIQIAFRFRQNGILLFNGDIFYTNLLYEKPNIPLDLYALNISNKHRDEKGITLDDRNQYQMEFVAKIPEPFHCTLISGTKWLEISIVTNDNLNPVYTIDTGNGEKKNPNYIHIEQSSFDLPFNIIKQTLSELVNNEKVHDLFHKGSTGSSITYDITMNNVNSVLTITGLNCFHIQIRLIHSEGFPSETPKIYYTNCKPWISEEFIESRNTGQKRPHEFDCDYSLGLPTCKEPKISEFTNNE